MVYFCRKFGKKSTRKTRILHLRFLSSAVWLKRKKQLNRFHILQLLFATFWDFSFKSKNIPHYYMHLCCNASILYQHFFLPSYFFVFNLFGLCMFNNCSCRKQKTDIQDFSIENSISIPALVFLLYLSRNTNSCSIKEPKRILCKSCSFF